MSGSITVTMPDPYTEEFDLELMSMSDGGFAFAGGIALSADELLALGTALKRWEFRQVKERDVTAREHARACEQAGEVIIKENQ